jgi:hypothetical protein
MMPGLQIYVRNGMSMFRDVRRPQAEDSYQIGLKGLVPGKRYVLRFNPLAGNKPLGLNDRGNTVNVSSNHDYEFTASGGSMTMTVLTRGGR